MLSARCTTPKCMNAPVRRRHHSPSAVNGPKLSPIDVHCGCGEKTPAPASDSATKTATFSAIRNRDDARRPSGARERIAEGLPRRRLRRVRHATAARTSLRSPVPAPAVPIARTASSTHPTFVRGEPKGASSRPTRKVPTAPDRCGRERQHVDGSRRSSRARGCLALEQARCASSANDSGGKPEREPGGEHEAIDRPRHARDRSRERRAEPREARLVHGVACVKRCAAASARPWRMCDSGFA